jgi:DNA polymerase kappa
MQCYLGLGRTQVQPAEEHERKSVGTESTFGDMSDPKELRDKLRATAEELEKDMVRTQFKGRTLCLKVKLHTYEVFTRQVIPGKAVYLADDLYKSAVPMLAKLEQEFPGMRLRLMGLRCTHLVSMKKADTMAFFGFKRKATESSEPSESPAPSPSKRIAETQFPNNEEEQWEEWPNELLFEDAERQEREDELEELENLSQEIDKRRHHGKEVVPNPTPKKQQEEMKEEEEWWDCPICMRPQATDEKAFNEHIDLCLSRQTIRDVVQQTSDTSIPKPREETPKSSKRGRPGNERKEKSGGRGDPKQRRLCFG